MILLSISPFIFIQCGSGGELGWKPRQKRKKAPREARGAGS